VFGGSEVVEILSYFRGYSEEFSDRNGKVGVKEALYDTLVSSFVL
jgi:hypothetical protein